MKRLLLIVVLLIGFLQATFASSLPSLIPYRARDDKWGFCNPKKEIIIPIQYDDARPYHRKRAAVKGGGSIDTGWYFINENGEKISKLYDEVEDFQDDCSVARVSLNGLWGLVNLKGEEIITPRYLYIRTFNNGLAWAVHHINRKYGVINIKGESMTEFIYDYFNDYRDGYALCGIYNNCCTEYGIIKSNGESIPKISYTYIADFGNRMWLVKKDTTYGYLSKKGKIKVGFNYKNACGFSDKLAIVTTNDKELVVINKKGKKLFSIANYIIGYEDPGYHCGRLAVYRDGKWGYLDEKGKLIIENKYDACTSFTSGIASVKLDGKWIFLNKEGMQISPLRFDENIVANYWTANDVGYQFQDDLCRVIYDGKSGYLDRNGNAYWQN